MEIYTVREGHCRVPAVFVERVDGNEVPLGAWVGYMRQRYRKNELSPERIACLEQILDWQWGPLSPGPSTNQNRNLKILELRESGESLRAIADVFELSRQRVHQIVQNKEQ
ncbi:MAG: Helicase associated domain protein [Polynucleobacter sp.]|nr:Helicase associated domain protein [Polynucleobacter sp.]